MIEKTTRKTKLHACIMYIIWVCQTFDENWEASEIKRLPFGVGNLTSVLRLVLCLTLVQLKSGDTCKKKGDHNNDLHTGSLTSGWIHVCMRCTMYVWYFIDQMLLARHLFLCCTSFQLERRQVWGGFRGGTTTLGRVSPSVQLLRTYSRLKTNRQTEFHRNVRC